MAARECTRCGKELTDAASMEVGVGPICRRMDNAVLATTIPANVFGARACFNTLNEGWLPQAQIDVALVYRAVKDEVLGARALTKTDWRATVRQVEWLLSHRETLSIKTALIQLVRDLGYIGLAAMWEGKASKSNATVSFDGITGRLHVTGVRNKYFREAVKKLQGWRFHSGSPNGSWSVPAASHEAFARLLQMYYPLHSGKELALLQARAWKPPTTGPQPASAPRVAPPPSLAPAQKDRLLIEQGPGIIRVYTPYSAGLIEDIKHLIPVNERSWNPQLKCWEIGRAFQRAMEERIQFRFGARPAYGAATAQTANVPAPMPVAQPKPAPAPARAPRAATPASRESIAAAAALPF